MSRYSGMLARRKGFEPLTPRFEVWCSIQLSYRRNCRRRVARPKRFELLTPRFVALLYSIP